MAGQVQIRILQKAQESVLENVIENFRWSVIPIIGDITGRVSTLVSIEGTCWFYQ